MVGGGFGFGFPPPLFPVFGVQTFDEPEDEPEPEPEPEGVPEDPDGEGGNGGYGRSGLGRGFGMTGRKSPSGSMPFIGLAFA